jgi:hypothetical protein
MVIAWFLSGIFSAALALWWDLLDVDDAIEGALVMLLIISLGPIAFILVLLRVLRG